MTERKEGRIPSAPELNTTREVNAENREKFEEYEKLIEMYFKLGTLEKVCEQKLAMNMIFGLKGYSKSLVLEKLDIEILEKKGAKEVILGKLKD